MGMWHGRGHIGGGYGLVHHQDQLIIRSLVLTVILKLILKLILTLSLAITLVITLIGLVQHLAHQILEEAATHMAQMRSGDGDKDRGTDRDRGTDGRRKLQRRREALSTTVSACERRLN